MRGYKLIQSTMAQYGVNKTFYHNKCILLYLYLAVSCRYEERNINKLYVCKIDNS